jgi:hypothetical protein
LAAADNEAQSDQISSPCEKLFLVLDRFAISISFVDLLPTDLSGRDPIATVSLIAEGPVEVTSAAFPAALGLVFMPTIPPFTGPWSIDLPRLLTPDLPLGSFPSSTSLLSPPTLLFTLLLRLLPDTAIRLPPHLPLRLLLPAAVLSFLTVAAEVHFPLLAPRHSAPLLFIATPAAAFVVTAAMAPALLPKHIADSDS